MLARLLLVISSAGSAGEDRPVDVRAKQAYVRMMGFAVALHAGDQPCNLSPEAQAIRAELLAWVYRLSGSGALPDGLAAAIGKFEGSFSRLCLVMHAGECAHAGLPIIAPEVSETTAQRVRDLILGLLFPHARRFYSDLIPDSLHYKVPQQVAGFILATDCEYLNVSMLHRSLSGWRHIAPQQRKEVLQTLMESGWLRKSGETGYAVNGAVHSCFPAQAQREAERRQKLAAILDEKLGRVRERDPGED